METTNLKSKATLTDSKNKKSENCFINSVITSSIKNLNLYIDSLIQAKDNLKNESESIIKTLKSTEENIIDIIQENQTFYHNIKNRFDDYMKKDPKNITLNLSEEKELCLMIDESSNCSKFYNVLRTIGEDIKNLELLKENINLKEYFVNCYRYADEENLIQKDGLPVEKVESSNQVLLVENQENSLKNPKQKNKKNLKEKTEEEKLVGKTADNQAVMQSLSKKCKMTKQNKINSNEKNLENILNINPQSYSEEIKPLPMKNNEQENLLSSPHLLQNLIIDKKLCKNDFDQQSTVSEKFAKKYTNWNNETPTSNRYLNRKRLKSSDEDVESTKSNNQEDLDQIKYSEENSAIDKSEYDNNENNQKNSENENKKNKKNYKFAMKREINALGLNQNKIKSNLINQINITPYIPLESNQAVQSESQNQTKKKKQKQVKIDNGTTNKIITDSSITSQEVEITTLPIPPKITKKELENEIIIPEKIDRVYELNSELNKNLDKLNIIINKERNNYTDYILNNFEDCLFKQRIFYCEFDMLNKNKKCNADHLAKDQIFSENFDNYENVKLTIVRKGKQNINNLLKSMENFFSFYIKRKDIDGSAIIKGVINCGFEKLQKYFTLQMRSFEYCEAIQLEVYLFKWDMFYDYNEEFDKTNIDRETLKQYISYGDLLRETRILAKKKDLMIQAREAN